MKNFDSLHEEEVRYAVRLRMRENTSRTSITAREVLEGIYIPEVIYPSEEEVFEYMKRMDEKGWVLDHKGRRFVKEEDKFVPHDTCHGCETRGQDGGYFCEKCNTNLTDEAKFNILGFWP